MIRVKDALGDRMKQQYEDRTRYMLPRRTYTIVRVDGKAFHTYTNSLKRPFDDVFMLCMDTAALAIATEIQGAELAYVQSDEISVLLTDFANTDTCAAFDGNLQKICSIAASAATMAFNDTARDVGLKPTALFDARVFTIPDPVEVENYFIWRQKDAERNSIQSVAQWNATKSELHGKNIAAQHEIIHAAGDNWNNYPGGCKRGRVVVYTGSDWSIEVPPIFTKDRAWLSAQVPRQWATEAKFESQLEVEVVEIPAKSKQEVCSDCGSASKDGYGSFIAGFQTSWGDVEGKVCTHEFHKATSKSG